MTDMSNEPGEVYDGDPADEFTGVPDIHLERHRDGMQDEVEPEDPAEQMTDDEGAIL